MDSQTARVVQHTLSVMQHMQPSDAFKFPTVSNMADTGLCGVRPWKEIPMMLGITMLKVSYCCTPVKPPSLASTNTRGLSLGKLSVNRTASTLAEV